MRIHRHRQRLPTLAIPTYRVNEKIIADSVRVVAPDKDLGVMSVAEGIEAARKLEMDLVEVSPKADPPVCKILDFGQFKYQKEKEVRKQKAQSKEIEVKGIRLTFRIGEHDLDVRKNQAIEFLARGDKIRIEMVLRGRERGHKDVAEAVVNRLLAAIRLTYPLRIEQPISLMGGKMTMIVTRS